MMTAIDAFLMAQCHVMEQSYYREVPRREIFMEQELRFGLDFGQLALLKKKIGRL